MLLVRLIFLSSFWSSYLYKTAWGEPQFTQDRFLLPLESRRPDGLLPAGDRSNFTPEARKLLVKELKALKQQREPDKQAGVWFSLALWIMFYSCKAWLLNANRRSRKWWREEENITKRGKAEQSSWLMTRRGFMFLFLRLLSYRLKWPLLKRFSERS